MYRRSDFNNCKTNAARINVPSKLQVSCIKNVFSINSGICKVLSKHWLLKTKVYYGVASYLYKNELNLALESFSVKCVKCGQVGVETSNKQTS